jgi:hypothetical protein
MNVTYILLDIRNCVVTIGAPLELKRNQKSFATAR